MFLVMFFAQIYCTGFIDFNKFMDHEDFRGLSSEKQEIYMFEKVISFECC